MVRWGEYLYYETVLRYEAVQRDGTTVRAVWLYKLYLEIPCAVFWYPRDIGGATRHDLGEPEQFR